MRVDLYSFVHKGQRVYLFELGIAIGRADFSRAEDAADISKRLSTAMKHLRDHAHNEEAYIHPLYVKLGEVGREIERSHAELETQMKKLESLVLEKQWHLVYPLYHLFLSKYLLHLADEEDRQENILWVHYDDATLLAVFNRFKSERAPQDSEEDLQLMLPALNLPELSRLFDGIRRSALPPAYAAARDVAAAVLGEKRWEQLQEYERKLSRESR